MNYSGPKVKKSKALGVALTPKAQRIMQKRRPATSGTEFRGRRRKKSDFGIQLLEKQRLRFQYNVGESYLRRTFERARKLPGSTGENLVQLLESRLDSIVLRAGLAPTIFAARQFVTHGHFELNGRKATIPSQRLKPGDVVTIRERSRKLQMFNEERVGGSSVPYVEADANGVSARFGYLPERHEIPIVCAESLVVEFYSR